MDDSSFRLGGLCCSIAQNNESQTIVAAVNRIEHPICYPICCLIYGRKQLLQIGLWG